MAELGTVFSRDNPLYAKLEAGPEAGASVFLQGTTRTRADGIDFIHKPSA